MMRHPRACILTCNVSRSSAVFKHLNKAGPSAAKNPSPRPASGAPDASADMSSIAVSVIQDSSSEAEATELQRLGNASLTTDSYTPSFRLDAKVRRTSDNNDVNIGSVGGDA